MLNTLCTNALIAGVGYQEKPVSARTVKQVTDNLLGTRSTARGARPWWYLLVALGLVLLLCVLWLSPVGDTITTPPTITAVRESLLARLKAYIPSWAQGERPEKSSIAEHPQPINPPELPTETPPMETPPTETPPPSETPVVHTPSDKPLDRDPKSSASTDGPPSSGAPPEPTQDEPDDTGSFPLTISVSPGEDIADIALEIYGFANDELFDLIKQNNPDVADLKDIKVGDKLILPALPKALEKFRGS